MSFWDRLRTKETPAPPASEKSLPLAAPQAIPPEPVPSDVDRLVRVGEDDGPALAEALAMFQRVRTSPEEGRAAFALLARHETHPLPEPLAVAVASAFVDRGEAKAAEAMLASGTSAAALLLAADLAADRGDLTTALALIERVLLRELDYPGARERHARWREALGFATARRAVPETATMVTSEPDSPFRLSREVARGGAGAVYEAEDRELLRRVALKVYHHPERDRAQLLHEAQAAVALAGPGVVRVFDVDPEHGWLALEWMELGALRDHVRDLEGRRRSAHRALGHRPSPAALARVHDAGWVHHDVKPANVLFAPPTAPLLTDFGTRGARRAEPPGEPGLRLAGADGGACERPAGRRLRLRARPRGRARGDRGPRHPRRAPGARRRLHRPRRPRPEDGRALAARFRS